MASGTFTAVGPEFELNNKDCYGFLTHVAYGPYGIVE